MRPELLAHARRQGGLVTRRQAVEADYSERELRTLTAVNGGWVVVRRGVYVDRAAWEQADPHDGQMALRDRAADLAMRQEHVLSHDSAARAWGLPLLRTPVPLVHITRPGVRGSRTEHGVKHHLTRSPLVTVDRAGLRVTTLARTALDVGREHGLPAGLVTCDAAMRVGLPRAAFHEELAGMTCWPSVTDARAAVRLADPGAETAGESLARLFVLELGIGAPRTQFPVRAGGTTYWTDLLVGCHVFEFDGRLKYLRPDAGGVADRPVQDVVWDEKRRQQLICAEGLGMSRLTWDDFWGRARERAKQRVLAEYAVTLARFGTVLPEHLERFARDAVRRRSA
jgi:hypothetical protein